jgi:hypothetical protein
MQDIEPHFGWLDLYHNEMDPNNPFHEVEHNQFEYDRAVYNYLAHPQWDEIGSESLLVKVLFADYDNNFAIIELFGVWNDLFENDYKLFAENCLTYFIDAGINRFVLIAENVLHIYLDADDYYQAIQEELNDGWIALLRPREHVRHDLEQAHISLYFHYREHWDDWSWRKMKPATLFQEIEKEIEGN